MGVIQDILSPVPLPRMVRVSQKFNPSSVDDIEKVLLSKLEEKRDLMRIVDGKSVAIAVGSRGIAQEAFVVDIVARELKRAGALPFIIPAMGSHGGATAQGQRKILHNLGVTEQHAPVRATMDVVRIGETDQGMPVYVDRYAHAADAIVLINRVKPHVAFRGQYESGLMKMIAIGLGKQKGAEVCHRKGMGCMAENITAIANVALRMTNILFGIALIENAYHKTCKIEILRNEEIAVQEPTLLKTAKSLIPKLYFDSLDVLIIDEIGKDISGTGFDTNVVGRYHTPYASGGPSITRIAALDITEASHGNGNGLGILDFTTRRAFEKFRFEQTYPNSLTSTVPTSVKIPMVLDNDRLAIKAAVKTCNRDELDSVKMVRIKNTLRLGEIEVSESLVAKIEAHECQEVLSDPYEIPFDEHGNLF